MNTYENRQCASITTAACRTSENCRNKLTADRSTTELRWIALGDAEHTVASPFVQGKRCFGTKEKLLTQHSSKKLVAGAGFEPAIPQARDYEPDRGNPIIRKNPSPRFCRLSNSSSFRASERFMSALCQISVQGPLPRVHFDTPTLCC
jgi:hypothetical protein